VSFVSRRKKTTYVPLRLLVLTAGPPLSGQHFIFFLLPPASVSLVGRPSQICVSGPCLKKKRVN
jgi:hypothetical protein